MTGYTCQRCGLPIRFVTKGWGHTVPLGEVFRHCGLAAEPPPKSGGAGLSEVLEAEG